MYLDEEQRVYTQTGNMWDVKGRYDVALEEDTKVQWVMKDGQDILNILMVSMVRSILLFHKS